MYSYKVWMVIVVHLDFNIIYNLFFENFALFREIVKKVGPLWTPVARCELVKHCDNVKSANAI